MNLKVLRLDPWMKTYHDPQFTKSTPKCEEITPIINRTGYYKLGKKVWFEVDGRAYEYKHHNFDYRLQIYNHAPLSERAIEAYKAVVASPFCKGAMKKKILELLELDGVWKETERVTGRYVVDAKKFSLRLKKKRKELDSKKVKR